MTIKKLHRPSLTIVSLVTIALLMILLPSCFYNDGSSGSTSTESPESLIASVPVPTSQEPAPQEPIEPSEPGSRTVVDRDFEFTIYVPQTTLQVGESISISVKLTNLTDREINLLHGRPLISAFVKEVDDETRVHTRQDIPLQSAISANWTIERTIEFEALNVGSYVFSARTWFDIGYVPYEISAEDIFILVVE